MHRLDLIMDFQYGSTGKGLIAGWLAKRNTYDTAICAFATNAGHTYIDRERDIHVMTQQLPTAITSPTVKTLMLGPGSAIHAKTLLGELDRYSDLIKGKRLLIHPQAAIVEDYHAEAERDGGMTKMGSTAKGVGKAYQERIDRRTVGANTAAERWLEASPLGEYVCTSGQWRDALQEADHVIMEGAQGYGLSMYHGFYPYTTSRDVTPLSILADCGVPLKWTNYLKVIGTLRTYPIRVNNRDGSSGPGYKDQEEISWDKIGVTPELTTVTKLPRRLFTFSQQQLQEAMFQCGAYWETQLFLNFCNYMHPIALEELIAKIQTPTVLVPNAPKVAYHGWGPDDSQVLEAM